MKMTFNNERMTLRSDTIKKNSYDFATMLSIDNTNCLRAVAIILVILQHITGFWTNIFTPLGGTGVAIFLFISGFGINESYKKQGLQRYWPKKFIRVLLPYFILQLVYLKIDKVNFWTFLLDVTGINSSYWYIGYLFKWYLVFYLSNVIVKRFSLHIMILSSIVMFLFLPAIEAEQSLSFVLGVFVSYKIEKIKSILANRVNTITLLTFSAGISLLTIKQLPIVRSLDGTYVFSIIQCIMKLSFAISFITGFHVIPKLNQNQILIFTGVISYELYLIHMKFLRYVNSNLINAIAVLIASYILSYIFYRLNKWNSDKILSRI